MGEGGREWEGSVVKGIEAVKGGGGNGQGEI